VLQHRSRAVVALLALALVAGVLAACGGGGGGGGSNDAEALLKQTFTGKHKIDSGKANLQLAVDVQSQGGSSPLNGPLKLTVRGPFQSAGSGAIPKFDLAASINAQGQAIQAGLTSTSDQLYVDFAGTAYQVPASLVAQLQKSFQQFQRKSAGSAGKLNLAGLGLDPMSWLSDASVAGKETVGGVETDHITAKLNVSALLDDVDKILAQISKQRLAPSGAGSVPTSIPANVRKQIEDAVKSATIDVWTGVDDKTLRKLALALDVQPASGSVKHASVAFSLELSDLNQPQTIKPPASPHPLNELLGQLSGLLGGALPGLGGATGDSGATGGSAGAPSSPQVQKYAQCLKDAAGDVAKAQACAALLTR
jgi:hypothetical protein